MARYVMIESRDPFVTRDVEYFYTLASSLAAHGDTVTLVLVQDGVLAARERMAAGPPTGAFSDGVEVLVDSFSLRERGIREEDLHASARPVEMDDIVDRMVSGNNIRVLWH